MRKNTEINHADDQDLYVRLDESSNIVETLFKGESKLILGLNFENQLHKIEAFVKDVRNTHEPGYTKHVSDDNRVTYQHPNLCSYADCMIWFDDMWHLIFERNLDLSENVKLFFRVFNKLRFKQPMSHPSELTDGYPLQTEVEFVNDLVNAIRSEAEEVEFRKAEAKRIRNARDNTKSLHRYVDALFARYSRLLVLRLDLHYQLQHLRYATLGNIRRDLATLLNNRRHNTIFQHIVGYIWKIEYGEMQGHHIHFIYFLDGAKAFSGYHNCKLIGEYWRDDVTEGKGYFHNCNAHARLYKDLGIGMISRDDHQMRQNLWKPVDYLAKSSQFISVVTGENVRTLGKGEMPKLGRRSRKSSNRANLFE